MPKQPTAYYRPRSIDEALTLLRQPNTVPLAGGTALLATEAGIDAAVVDLQDAGLNSLTWADDGRVLRLGAMVRLVRRDLAERGVLKVLLLVNRGEMRCQLAIRQRMRSLI